MYCGTIVAKIENKFVLNNSYFTVLELAILQAILNYWKFRAHYLNHSEKWKYAYVEVEIETHKATRNGISLEIDKKAKLLNECESVLFEFFS